MITIDQEINIERLLEAMYFNAMRVFLESNIVKDIANRPMPSFNNGQGTIKTLKR